MTCSHIHCTFRPNWQLPENGQDIWPKHVGVFDVLLTVHLSIFISVINQLDAQHSCFIIS